MRWEPSAPKLATLPATPTGSVTAGLTFAVPRNLHDMPPADLAALLAERLEVLRRGAAALEMDGVTAILTRIEKDFRNRTR